MTQLMASIATTLFYCAHHVVHGVHDGTTQTIMNGRGGATTLAPYTAFQHQLPCYKYRNNKQKQEQPSVTSFRLDYSSDEGGGVIYDWLQPKQQQLETSTSTSTADDSSDNMDHQQFAANRWDCNNNGDEHNRDVNIIEEYYTNDANERRSRRLQSLNKFNQQANINIIAQQQQQQQHYNERSRTSIENYEKQQPSTDLLELPYNDLSQLQAIKSNAPAILLPSGPGTGKSHVLSLRIAYLLQKFIKRKKTRNSNAHDSFDSHDDDDDECDMTTPDSMVILSFTNKDATRLKERALGYLFPLSQGNNAHQIMQRNETSQQLWAGTMHAFSLAILNKYGGSSSTPSIRVLPAREMRNRVSASLQSLLKSSSAGGGEEVGPDRKVQGRHLEALNDVGQSRSILHQNIVRCIELWKEANIPLTPPEPSSSVLSVHQSSNTNAECQQQQQHQQEQEVRVRKSCMELAMRLGIPKSSAMLALDVYPEYQTRHARVGSADPSDLAGMAYRLLVGQPKALTLLRTKLKHIIVDEYQDMSVSQHALLRLIVRGVINEDKAPTMMTGAMRKKKKAEQRRRRRLPVLLEPTNNDHGKRKFKARSHTNRQGGGYSVPSIFCAGDASQSIYGWRGGAPELTVHGFRTDYPQGVIAPLEICYRLPNDIIEAAAMLLPMEGGLDGEKEGTWDHTGEEEDVLDSYSYDVSPAAAAKVASSIISMDSPPSASSSSNVVNAKKALPYTAEENVRLGNQLLLSKGMQKLDSTVLIHGLWDTREEAKYIASTIRRRSKERRRALISALGDLEDDVSSSFPSNEELLDLTDVAVMVRSSNQLPLIKEALTNAGIPFVTDKKKHIDPQTKEEEDSQSWLSQKRASQVNTIPMKPAVVCTMHRSKGEEFDDVYLAGWTEGEFPHSDAVSSNRVYEERRLAYVALTRARQRVAITHSFMKRVLHYGKDGRKKYVTGQVQPSRFLYELMPSKRIEDGVTNGEEEKDDGVVPWLSSSSDNKGTVWNRSSGVKDYVAGQNLPNHFQKSYEVPAGYVAKRSDVRQFANMNSMATNTKSKPKKQPESHEKTSQRKTPLEIVEDGLKDIVALRKKGASKKYSPIFKEMIASFFQIRRGRALVFAAGARSKQTRNASVHALLEASSEDLVKKPLGKCTATQLGHYLAYLILKKPYPPAATEHKILKPSADDTNRSSSKQSERSDSSYKEQLQIIEDGLKDIIVHQNYGASKKYSPLFKDMLVSLFEIRRGSALVFKQGAMSKETQNESVYALVEASADDLVKKPLGKCTAIQLGHYLAYLILLL